MRFWNKRVFFYSLLLSMFTIFLPLQGESYPMEFDTTIVKGFPIAFLGFVDEFYYKNIFSLFSHWWLIGVNLINFIFNVGVFYIVFFIINKIIFKQKVVTSQNEK
ncbi:hypothetical protein [Paraliobacillus sp. JSM ZJ581]|uniref:hypothetical protein n=1 Tax=Paraliobacillus sp. JSM ZJ581 TaxID=3342118 RepID=UPI0035A8881A